MKIARLTLPWAKTSDLSMNSRLHWRKKARLVKNQKGYATSVAWDAKLHLKRGDVPASGPIFIDLTYCPPSNVSTVDADNVVTAQKAALDAFAAVLQVDDSRFVIRSVTRGERCRDGGVIFEIEVAA